MAATLLGTTLTFGCPTLASRIVQSVSFNETVSIAEVLDEDGDPVAASLYNRKIEGTVESINAGATTAIGATLAVTGAPTGTYYLTGRSISRTNEGFQTLSETITSWSGIS